MFVASRVPVPVGVIAWPDGAAATIVVKRTYHLVGRGVGAPSADQDPLGIDQRDDAGELVVPSDFAPTKAFCDVAIVGQALRDPRGPVRVVVDPMRKLAARAADLGPRSSADPTDAATCGDWTSAAFDFERFQWSARDQRLPPPPLPLDLVVDVGPQRFVTRIEGPSPDCVVVDESGWATPQPLALRVDGIQIDLARLRVHVVWRGITPIAAGARPLLAVDVAGQLGAFTPHDMILWPRATASEPGFLKQVTAMAARRAPGGAFALQGLLHGAAEGARAPDARRRAALDTFGDDDLEGATTTGVIVAPGGPTFGAPPTAPTFGARPSAPRVAVGDDEEEPDALTTTVATTRSPAATVLPFSERAVGAAAHAPAPLPAVRPPSETMPAVDEQEQGDPLVGTVALAGLGSRAALPFQSAAQPPMAADEPAHRSEAAPLARTGTLELDVTGLQAALDDEDRSARPPILAAPLPPSQAEVEPAHGTIPQEIVDGLSASQFASIKAELWSGATPRREALARHGLSEIDWSAAERRLAAHLKRGGRRLDGEASRGRR